MFHSIARRAAALHHDRRGVTALEYGLIAALVALVVVGAVSSFGPQLATTFSAVSAQLH